MSSGLMEKLKKNQIVHMFSHQNGPIRIQIIFFIASNFPLYPNTFRTRLQAKFAEDQADQQKATVGKRRLSGVSNADGSNKVDFDVGTGSTPKPLLPSVTIDILDDDEPVEYAFRCGDVQF